MKPSIRTVAWRKKNKELIEEWRNKVSNLRDLANLEIWSHERLEIETTQLLHPTLRKVYDYASRYARRHKRGQFRELMANVAAEIIEYGTVEPSRFQSVIKAIEGAKRRIRDKKK